MTIPPARVLVVDDSMTSRRLLVELCRRDPDLEVVGEAGDGRQALEMTKRLRPSILVMDIEMPVMDGFEATKRVMIEQPTPVVIVTAHHDPSSVEIALRTLRAGALTALPKPGGPGTPEFEADAARLVSLIKALAQVKVVRARGPRGSPPVKPRVPRRQPVEAVGVVASTGGPAAVYRFLEALPRTVEAPVLVVQHIADGFAPGLARWLGTATVLPVVLARGGEPLQPATVYLAPDDRHLVVEDRTTRLSRSAKVGGFRPSADVLLSSLADAYGAAAAGVVLTGMGNDGLDGARRLREAGGLVLAQDEASSVVFGMPRAVVDAGLADLVGPVDDLVGALVPLTSGPKLRPEEAERR